MTWAASSTEWLAAQAQADGSYTSPATIATPYQATAEVLRTFRRLSEAVQPGIPAAHQYLNAEPYHGTEYLARRIVADIEAGHDVTALVTELVSAQNLDGGFGDLPGYESTVLDTAFALEALAAAGRRSDQVAGYAIGFLLNRQMADGAWTNGMNTSSVYLTALAAIALEPYRYLYAISTNLQRAGSFLLARRSTAGVLEPFETALALLALAPITFDKTAYQVLIADLLGAQLADGSWAGDVYQTALALRALSVAQTSAAPNPTLGIVAGRVTDSLTGTPLAGVAIDVSGADTKHAVTDANGQYAIADVMPGQVSLTASLGGYLTTSMNGTVVAGQTFDFSPRLARDPQPVPITLTGTAVDADSGGVLAGVAVRVANTTLATQSGPDGRFTLDGIPAGSIVVELNLSGYTGAAYTVSAAAGGAVDLGSVPLRQGVPSGTSGTIEGVVRDAASGAPLRGAAVSVSGADTKAVYSGTDGRFVIGEVAPGTVTMAVTLEGYRAALGSGAVVAGTTLNFNVSLIKASDPALVTVKGAVMDGATQAPLPGATITVADTSFTAMSSADGAFQLSGLPAGAFTVQVALPGYTGVAYTVTAPAGGLVELGTIALAPDVPISTNRNPIIASAGPPKANAGYVYAYNVQASDPDGNPLTYGLASYPNGMTIDPANGQIRWIPTIEQAGERSFTVVVADDQGGRAEQTVYVQVSTGGSRSYVITDVQTLNGLTINATVPSNYVLARYVSGAVPGFVSAAPSCPLTWYYGSGTVANAATRLDRLAFQPAPGYDTILDLGSPFSSVTVFPQIDHGPFPQEGIEYTVWGSDDPNAPFPSAAGSSQRW